MAINPSESVCALESFIDDVSCGLNVQPSEARAAVWELENQISSLYSALKWYVENDDTNIGQEGNGFWEEGKKRAEAILAKIEAGA